MILLELAVSGLRHFGGFTRIPIKPGLNTVWGGNQSGKTTLWQVIRQLLVRDGRLKAPDDVRSWGRAALTFQGDDGNTYCLARQFSEATDRLARHRPGEGFIPLDLPGPDRGPVDPQPEGEPSLWSACLGGAAWLPSTRLRPSRNGRTAAPESRRPAVPGDAEPSGGTGLDLVPSGLSIERAAAERRLEALQRVEVAAHQAARMEEELAACYGRIGLLRSRLETISRAAAERDAAYQEMAALEAVAGVTPEMEAEAAAFETDLRQVRARQQAIEADIAEVIDDLDRLPVPRPWREWPLYGAAVLVGTAALIRAIAGPGWVPDGLLLVGAFLGGVLLYRIVTVRRRRDALQRQIAVRSGDADALEEGLRAAHEPMFERLRAAGLSSTGALIRQRERHRLLTERLERLDARTTELLGGDGAADLEAERDRLEARITELEEVLGCLQVSGVDAEAAHREHEALARALDKGLPVESEEPPVDLSIEPHLEAEPALRAVLDRRREQYCARAGDYLARFTGGEFTGLSVNGGYRPTLHTERDGGEDAGPPGAGMVDLIYLAQYLAMVETLDPTGRFPMVLDEPFLSLDPERRTLLYDTLREAARSRQVVVFTCQQFLTSPGDHLVRLKG